MKLYVAIAYGLYDEIPVVVGVFDSRDKAEALGCWEITEVELNRIIEGADTYRVKLKECGDVVVAYIDPDSRVVDGSFRPSVSISGRHFSATVKAATKDEAIEITRQQMQAALAKEPPEFKRVQAEARARAVEMAGRQK